MRDRAAHLRHIADGGIAARRRRPSTRMVPRLGGTRPRMARISVVLPAPFGPSTPTNSHAAISRLTPSRMARPPSARRTSRNSMAFMPLSAQRASTASSSLMHPGLVGLAGRLGLRRADDRDVRRLGQLLHARGDRVRRLAVIDQQLHPVRLAGPFRTRRRRTRPARCCSSPPSGTACCAPACPARANM